MSYDKKPWTLYVTVIQEDDSLKALMLELQGDFQWCQISRLMLQRFGIKNRSGKQCRERWFNHLDPSTRKREWTQDEEMIIFNYQQMHGNQWSEIAKFLIGRSDNTIKNHFYATIRRKLRRYNKINSDKILIPLKDVMNSKDLVKMLMEVPEKEKLNKPIEM